MKSLLRLGRQTALDAADMKFKADSIKEAGQKIRGNGLGPSISAVRLEPAGAPHKVQSSH